MAPKMVTTSNTMYLNLNYDGDSYADTPRTAGTSSDASSLPRWSTARARPGPSPLGRSRRGRRPSRGSTPRARAATRPAASRDGRHPYTYTSAGSRCREARGGYILVSRLRRRRGACSGASPGSAFWYQPPRRGSSAVAGNSRAASIEAAKSGKYTRSLNSLSPVVLRVVSGSVDTVDVHKHTWFNAESQKGQRGKCPYQPS